METNDLSKFKFQFAGYGFQRVRYTTNRGDYWVATLEDGIVEDVSRAERPKVKDLEQLLYWVKLRGTHYRKDGRVIHRTW